MHSKRPELDTENPPGQIVNPIPQAKYLRDVIQRIEHNEKEWLEYSKERNDDQCGVNGFDDAQR